MSKNSIMSGSPAISLGYLLLIQAIPKAAKVTAQQDKENGASESSHR